MTLQLDILANNIYKEFHLKYIFMSIVLMLLTFTGCAEDNPEESESVNITV
jgi:hypothetical protein